MKPWANETHYRLWLQGHHGRTRQQIIDRAEYSWFDTVALGAFIASQNWRQLDNLEIEMPPSPWYVEVWDTIIYVFKLVGSVLKYGCGW